MVELLKQDQYQPIPVEQQIVSIFMGINGYLDEVGVWSRVLSSTEISQLYDNGLGSACN